MMARLPCAAQARCHGAMRSQLSTLDQIACTASQPARRISIRRNNNISAPPVTAAATSVIGA